MITVVRHSHHDESTFQTVCNFTKSCSFVSALKNRAQGKSDQESSKGPNGGDIVLSRVRAVNVNVSAPNSSRLLLVAALLIQRELDKPELHTEAEAAAAAI